MKRIALVYPEIGFAGPDTVAVWLAESLLRNFKVDLVTTKIPDFKKLNTFFHTHLNESLRVQRIYLPNFMLNTPRARLLKQHFLMRYCKIHKYSYDLFISAYNEMDFGIKGIQYVHFPEINSEAKFVLRGNLYKNSLARSLYENFVKAISRYDRNNICNNLTLTNSHWTKEVIDKVYGINSRVVYPPVLNDFEIIPWENKENGFVFIGRISPDKRPLEIIQILKNVRKRVDDIHIHILGNAGIDMDYVNRVEKEAKDNHSWIFYEGKVSRNELRNIVSAHKYGISGKKYEHFGIGIAEMVTAGNIVFINDDGGQVDIVGREDDLIYHSDSDAVNKIGYILSNRILQNKILERLKILSRNFSKDKFNNEILEIVDSFLNDI